MDSNLKEKWLDVYRKSHSIGVGWLLIIPIPCTIAAIVFVIIGINSLIKDGEISGAINWVLGSLAFMLPAFLFGWGPQIDYIKNCRMIKREKFVAIRAECKSKKIFQATIDTDSSDTYDHCRVTFETELREYGFSARGIYRDIEPNEKYLLLMFDNKGVIEAILNEDNEFVYFR